MRAYYRIYTDSYSGFEVCIWRWWFPFWVQADGCNTHTSIERAEEFAFRHRRRVVKDMGKL